jgi:hypothetical protein
LVGGLSNLSIRNAVLALFRKTSRPCVGAPTDSSHPPSRPTRCLLIFYMRTGAMLSWVLVLLGSLLIFAGSQESLPRPYPLMVSSSRHHCCEPDPSQGFPQSPGCISHRNGHIPIWTFSPRRDPTLQSFWTCGLFFRLRKPSSLRKTSLSS